MNIFASMQMSDSFPTFAVNANSGHITGGKQEVRLEWSLPLYLL